MAHQNRRIIFAKRPDGLPTEETFVPDVQDVSDLEPGEYLLRVNLLSMDPALVGRMRAESKLSIDLPPE